MNVSETQRIVLASKNRGKIRELNALLEGMGIELLSLYDFLDAPEIEEDGTSFFENSLKKARAVSEYTGMAVIADDSGLEVDALGGAPGIHSARYSGIGATDEKNIAKLLAEMESVPDGKREASFRCALVLYGTNGEYEAFEGELRGVISRKPSGTAGFGYDPIFVVPDYGMTVAELDPATKNKISHRGKAFARLKESLQKRTLCQ